MSYPDTPEVAAALDADQPAQALARTRLLQFFQLCSGQETSLTQKQQEVAVLLAQLQGEATLLAQIGDLKAERDSLADQLAIYTSPSEGLTPREFKKRLIPLYVNLAGASTEAQRKWDRLLALTGEYTVIQSQLEPVSSLIGMAVAEGLLTEADADYLKDY